MQNFRRTKCIFCSKEMYYINDPRHEPEITIDYGTGNHSLEFRRYAHIKCAKEYLPLEDEK